MYIHSTPEKYSNKFLDILKVNNKETQSTVNF